MVFENLSDYDIIEEMDEFKIENVREQIEKSDVLIIENVIKGLKYRMILNLIDRQCQMILYGGFLNFIKVMGMK